MMGSTLGKKGNKSASKSKSKNAKGYKLRKSGSTPKKEKIVTS